MPCRRAAQCSSRKIDGGGTLGTRLSEGTEEPGWVESAATARRLVAVALQLHSIHIWVTSPSVKVFFMDSQSLSQSPK